METSLGAVAGGLGVIVLGLIATVWRNGKVNGGATMYDVLTEIREVKTILKERLPHR
jgi:hypothetical protein